MVQLRDENWVEDDASEMSELQNINFQKGFAKEPMLEQSHWEINMSRVQEIKVRRGDIANAGETVNKESNWAAW